MAWKRTFSLYLSFSPCHLLSPLQHCPLDIFQSLKLWRQYSCYVLILFMLFLQSRISWSCVDYFRYWVIQLTDKNTSSGAHNVLFCALFLILIVVFHLFFLLVCSVQYFGKFISWSFFPYVFFFPFILLSLSFFSSYSLALIFLCSLKKRYLVWFWDPSGTSKSVNF